MIHFKTFVRQEQFESVSLQRRALIELMLEHDHFPIVYNKPIVYKFLERFHNETYENEMFHLFKKYERLQKQDKQLKYFKKLINN